MMENGEISVINGVTITKEGNITHFTTDIPDRQIESEPSMFDKIKNWFIKSNVKPYVNTRDFNNQGNDELRQEDNKPVNGIEIGIRGEF